MLKRGFKHGLYYHPLYHIWSNMKDRCYNSNYRNYCNYGGRGIVVCDRWINSVENFIKDMYGSYVQGLILERIDNDGDYEPNNCTWATYTEQNRNRGNNIMNLNKANEIRELYKTGNYTQRQLAKIFNYDQGNIANIINNKLWKEFKYQGKDLF